MRFSVILACHNRKALTLRSILQAQASADAASVTVAFTVYDDGSTDGTAEALAGLQLEINVLAGDGSAFWARGMAHAEAAVLAKSESALDDYVVWMNDDVHLDLDAFTRLREMAERNPSAILVGAMRDPVTLEVTYSGLDRQGLHPLGFARVPPRPYLQNVHTFNGNLVLVPLRTARSLGGIDGSFSHALADIDYGLRAARLNVPVFLASGTFGECAANPLPPARTVGQDWASFTGPKGGGNFGSLRQILRKSNRKTWLAYVGATYGLWWARRVMSATQRGMRR